MFHVCAVIDYVPLSLPIYVYTHPKKDLKAFLHESDLVIYNIVYHACP